MILSIATFPKPRGFYIDVGAYHPWRASNTYKLYLRGWSGLTVKPNPAVRRLFRRYRPRDIHVSEGIAETDENLIYRQFRDTQLNTFSAELASEYELKGARRAGEIRVPCRPLQAVIDQYARNKRIDLLSVDCEGFDQVVLKTLDFSRSRPTVILVEDFAAFESLSVGKTKSEIEHLLRVRGFAPVCQAVLSTLYVDIASVRANDRAVSISTCCARPIQTTWGNSASAQIEAGSGARKTVLGTPQRTLSAALRIGRISIPRSNTSSMTLAS